MAIVACVIILLIWVQIKKTKKPIPTKERFFYCPTKPVKPYTKYERDFCCMDADEIIIYDKFTGKEKFRIKKK